MTCQYSRGDEETPWWTDQLVLVLFRGLGLGLGAAFNVNVNVNAVGIMDITKSHEMRHVIHWKHGTDGEKEMNRLALLW